MKKIRVAQIGTSQNSHGNSIWCSFKKQSDIFEIVGYAMPENEREKFPARMKDFEGYPEMTVEEIMNDPTIDAVAVETEEIYLTKYAQMVADAKKHMHMEKPGGTDLAAFEKLIATVKSNGTVFHTGYMYRYNSYVMQLKEDIRAGKLGEIISVEAQMNCLHLDTVRDWLKCFPGGMMFFLGCHLVDLIYSIQGAPKRVIPMSKCTGIDGVAGEDFGMAAFEYEKGWSFAKTNANEHGGFGRTNCPVVLLHGHIGIFGQVSRYGIVKLEQTLFPQLHCSRTGDRLGAGIKSVSFIAFYREFVFQIGITVPIVENTGSVLIYPQIKARDAHI